MHEVKQTEIYSDWELEDLGELEELEVADPPLLLEGFVQIVRKLCNL